MNAMKTLQMPSGDYTLENEKGERCGKFPTEVDAQRVLDRLERLESMMDMALKLLGRRPTMTKAAAARHIGVSPQTFQRRYIDSGKIAVRSNGQIRRKDVEGIV